MPHIEFVGSYFEKPTQDMPTHKAPFLDDAVLAAATARFVVSCNDIYFIDTMGRIVLAKRRIAAARGWWVFGGAATTGITVEESVAKILKREIGVQVDNLPVPFALFEHHWADTRERPGQYRQDRILAWYVQVSEKEISNITLDPAEFEAEAGLLRFDGSQEGFRQVLYDMHKLIMQRL